MNHDRRAYWKTTPLDRMTGEQWENLCDGCGRCCLQKFKNPTTGKIYYTSVACFLLDLDSCRCTAYPLRRKLVPECLRLTPSNVARLHWLPRTCAYRLLAGGKDLPSWHHLVSRDPESIHRAGISVRHRAISETLVHPDDVEFYLLDKRL